jgi:hypothetical protein
MLDQMVVEVQHQWLTNGFGGDGVHGWLGADAFNRGSAGALSDLAAMVRGLGVTAAEIEFDRLQKEDKERREKARKEAETY